MSNNLEWSKNILSTLYTSGVRYLCLAPGSRSSPLAAAAAESDLEVLVHFDERGLGFLALGLAKVNREPVAILVTSGTAVGNLLPSLMEASHDDLPLIILSADRPPELRDCGANQTSDQTKIFQNFVRWHVDLPCADSSLSSYLTSTISYAVAMTKQRKGPIQINCMFREPLLTGEETLQYLGGCHHEEGHLELPAERIEELAANLSSVEEGLIICGQEAPKEALLLAERLQWPLFADVASSLRGQSCCEITHYELMLKNFSVKAPQAIVQFGRRITSKTLLAWCKTSDPSIFIQIDDNWNRFDPHHSVKNHIKVEPASFAKRLISYLPYREETEWLLSSKLLSAEIEEKIDDILECSYSEPGFIHLLAQMNAQNLYLGNSMPIRDAEKFFFPKEASGRVFVNRGLSGIDGNIATIAGIAYALESPLIAVVGDLTFLHDINSLAIAAENPLPLFIIIVNNQGGGIFSFLPHLQKMPHFEQFVACAHNYQFKSAAELFGIPYHAPTTSSELISCLQAFDLEPKLTLVEVSTQRESNYTLHQEIEELVQNLSCKSLIVSDD